MNTQIENKVHVSKHRVGDIDNKIGIKLQKFREMFNITQSELGRAINVTFQQIQKYEKGTNRMHAGVIWKIALTFDIPVDFFYDNNETEFDEKSNNNINITLNNIQYNDKDSIKLVKYYMQIKDLNIKKKISNLISSIIEIEDN